MPGHNIFATVTIEILVILTVARLLGVAVRALGQPQVVGEVMGGILLGPSLLGWLAPGVSAKLFPPETLPYLKLLSEFGILFFMFLVGLELDPALMRGRGRAAVATSHSSILTPFVLGLLLAHRIYEAQAPAGVPFWSFALFMGAAMSVTAFPVLARILVERDLLRTRVGAITITCAAVDDITAWCLLAFVVATVTTTSLGHAVQTLVLTLGYVAAMLVLVRPLLGRLHAMVDRTGRLSQNVVAVIFVLVLASSLATEVSGPCCRKRGSSPASWSTRSRTSRSSFCCPSTSRTRASARRSGFSTRRRSGSSARSSWRSRRSASSGARRWPRG
jgi:Kef-type K+ transport system membrane component KefB